MGDWVAFVLCVTLAWLAPVGLYRHWVGRSMEREYLVAGYWYRSEPLRQGHVRATGTLLLGLLLLAVAAFFYVFHEPPADWTTGLALGVLLLLSLALIASYWSIVLFNRPSFLVAPHYRDEPGAGRRRAAGGAGRGGR